MSRLIAAPTASATRALERPVSTIQRELIKVSAEGFALNATVDRKAAHEFGAIIGLKDIHDLQFGRDVADSLRPLCGSFQSLPPSDALNALDVRRPAGIALVVSVNAPAQALLLQCTNANAH